MPTVKPYKYELVTPETRMARITDRLRAYEEELVNIQINLAVDEAAYAGTDTANNQAVLNHQASLDMTLARIEAVKKLRAEAKADMPAEPTVAPAP